LFGDGDGVEVGREFFERIHHFGASHGSAVAGDDEGGGEDREFFDREAGRFPVGCVVHGRSVEFGGLGEDGVGRFLVGGDEGIANNQGAVAFSEVGDVTG
jgi:hypothetical protein